MDFNQNTQQEPQNEQTAMQNQPVPETPLQEQVENRNIASVQQPGSPQQNSNPYSNGNPYQYNGQPQNNNPYPNGNPYWNNRPNDNGYYGNNGYPYYNRNLYQAPPAEPGSNLATAAMVLGIASIVFCFTFTLYPAFITGSIAIILALLSKGRRPKHLSRAVTGLTCAVIGLTLNVLIIVATFTLIFTNPNVRAEVNRTFERTYGQSFDEMLEEIMEENESSY